MDSDDEIFLTQNTFSQEAFSPELNLEELLGDFSEVSDRDSVEVEKKENPGCNIVVVCDNEVEKRRESRIPANTKVNRELKHQTFSTGRRQPEVKFTSDPRFPPTE